MLAGSESVLVTGQTFDAWKYFQDIKCKRSNGNEEVCIPEVTYYFVKSEPTRDHEGYGLVDKPVTRSDIKVEPELKSLGELSDELVGHADSFKLCVAYDAMTYDGRTLDELLKKEQTPDPLTLDTFISGHYDQCLAEYEINVNESLERYAPASTSGEAIEFLWQKMLGWKLDKVNNTQGYLIGGLKRFAETLSSGITDFTKQVTPEAEYVDMEKMAADDDVATLSQTPGNSQLTDSALTLFDAQNHCFETSNPLTEGALTMKCMAPTKRKDGSTMTLKDIVRGYAAAAALDKRLKGLGDLGPAVYLYFTATSEWDAKMAGVKEKDKEELAALKTNDSRNEKENTKYEKLKVDINPYYLLLIAQDYLKGMEPGYGSKYQQLDQPQREIYMRLNKMIAEKVGEAVPAIQVTGSKDGYKKDTKPKTCSLNGFTGRRGKDDCAPKDDVKMEIRSSGRWSDWNKFKDKCCQKK